MTLPAPGTAEFDTELARLVGQMTDIESRLQALTGGQVDAVLAPTGTTHLLAQAQQRLTASEAEQRRMVATQTAVLNALPAQVALIDAQGRIISVNDAWLQFSAAHGLPDAAFGVGGTYAGIGSGCHGDDSTDDVIRAQAAAGRGLRAVLSGQAAEFSMRYPWPTPTTQRWYRLMVTPLDRTRPAGVVVMHIDITEHVQAELQRQQLNDRLTHTLESLTDGFMALDRDWRVTYLNPLAERMLARTRTELLGQVIWEQFLGAAATPAGQAAQRAMQTQDAVQLVDHLLPADRWFDLRMYGSAQGLAIYARDVTRERRLAAQLEEERRRHVEAQAVARMGSWEAYLDSDEVIWSEEHHRIFETDPKTFQPTRSRVMALIHPDYRPAVEAAFVASFESKAPQSIEHRLTMPDGRIKYIEERWRVVPTLDGKRLRALGACQDITERRLAEQDLRRSQALVDLAGRMARLGAWSVELRPMVLHWSDVVASIHEEPAGYAPPAVDLAINYYAPEYRDTVRASFVRCVEDGTPFDLELQLITAKGRRRSVRLIGQAERDDAGCVVRVHGAFQDISELKGAEQATRELAERLQTTLESITDGFITLDEQWRFSYVNRQAELLLGRERASLLGRNMWIEFPGSLGGAAQQAYEHAAREGVATAFEHHYAPLNRWFDANVYPSTQGLAVYFRDITGRKKDQDALRELNAELEHRVLARTAELARAREEAEQANQAKSAFLAAMSHEIRTPMNGVIGMIDVLQQTSLQGHQIEMVDLIRESAYSLLRIIEDILDFSKIEAGRMDIERTPLCLGDVVESVCGMLDPIASKRGVLIAKFADPAIPPLLLGDEARLRQVLVNLVGNAIKFSGDGGRLGRVAVRAHLLADDGRSVTVEVSVSDNGIGMDEATMSRLFTPFSQADASTTRRFGGTGLGLAISGTLVELMGGRISVRSATGQGAVFTVVLTLARAEGEAPVEPAAAVLAGLRCCLIGGDLPLGDDLAAYLQHAGVHVERAAQPVQAGAAAVWVVLPSQAETPVDSLRTLARRAGGDDTCFVVLGSGYRRRPRVEAPDLILMDHCGLTRRLLYRMLALSREPRLAAGEETELVDARQLAAARAAPRGLLLERGQILVAEDNETNRKVIQQQLHLVGYHAEFAEDGQQALELWRGGDFVLVFTDLHMPRMDGYALAAAIRAEEQGARRTAIVALTANALHDEELRCRAAGMDAYLSKPVRLARLQATIEQWLQAVSEVAGPGDAGVASGARTGGAVTAAQAVNAVNAMNAVSAASAAGAARATLAPLVDLSVLKALIGDDEAVVGDVLRAFRDSALQCSAALVRASASGDLQAVAEAAHKLKSGARSIGAQALGERCRELEVAAESGRHGAVAALLLLFQAELAAVLHWLEQR